MTKKTRENPPGGAKMLGCAALCSTLLWGCASVTQTETPLPQIIAHRAGTGDFPENTLLAAREAVGQDVDVMWLTVQLSKDGVPVLYRPADLSAGTQGKGPVADKTVQELKTLNAGWNFKRIDVDGRVTYPYRDSIAFPYVPTLEEVLDALPTNIPVILDMKALPAEPQVQAVAALLERKKAWSRVSIYSTEAAYQQAFKQYPQATLFESRDATRNRLVKVSLGAVCDVPPTNSPVGFEYRRDIEVVEKFTLGEGRSPVNAVLWTPATMQCFKRQPGIKVIAFNVNTAEDYKAAACLGIDAVLADSPQKMKLIRTTLRSAPSLQCTFE